MSGSEEGREGMAQVVQRQQQGMTAGLGVAPALWARVGLTQLLTAPSSGSWKDRWGSEVGTGGD